MKTGKGEGMKVESEFTLKLSHEEFAALLELLGQMSESDYRVYAKGKEKVITEMYRAMSNHVEGGQ